MSDLFFYCCCRPIRIKTLIINLQTFPLRLFTPAGTFKNNTRPGADHIDTATAYGYVTTTAVLYNARARGFSRFSVALLSSSCVCAPLNGKRVACTVDRRRRRRRRRRYSGSSHICLSVTPVTKVRPSHHNYECHVFVKNEEEKKNSFFLHVIE